MYTLEIFLLCGRCDWNMFLLLHAQQRSHRMRNISLHFTSLRPDFNHHEQPHHRFDDHDISKYHDHIQDMNLRWKVIRKWPKHFPLVRLHRLRQNTSSAATPRKSTPHISCDETLDCSLVMLRALSFYGTRPPNDLSRCGKPTTTRF